MTTLKLTKQYTRYPKYKHSGVEWVGEIPVDWEMGRVKQYFKRMERPVVLGSEVVTAFRDGTVTLRSNRREDGFTMSDKEIGYQGIEKGDLVVHAMDAFAGAIGISDSDGKSTPVYSALRSLGDTDERYYMYLLRHMSKSQYIFALAKGIRERSTEFRYKELASLIVPKPSLEQQRKIAAYLDEKAALIDAIIEKKKKQIELLREKRAAIINRAVTKAEGKMIRLRHHVSVNPSKREAPIVKENEMVSFLPMEAVSETGVVSPQDRKYSDVKDGFTYFRDGDVVLAKITPCYENGKAAVIKRLNGGYGYGTTEFLVLRPDESILPEYLYFVVYSDNFRKQGEIEMRGSAGQKRVSDKFVRNFQIHLPNRDEQLRVVDELTAKLELYDQLSGYVEQSITLLQEFKSALISHVVTGKVKV